MKYHKSFNEVLASSPSSPECRLQFTPRLYTCERFCASISIDHFSNLQSYQGRGLVRMKLT